MTHVRKNLAVALFAALALVSCKDDKKEDPVPPKAELIVGKWEATSTKYTDKTGGTAIAVAQTKEHPIYLTFNKDGSMIHDGWYDESTDADVEDWKRTVESGTYTLSSNAEYLTFKGLGDDKKDDILAVKELTANRLVVAWEQTEGTLELDLKK